MPDTSSTSAPKTPDPALVASIADDIEAGRLGDAETLLAQLEGQGYGGEDIARLKDRLARGHFAMAMASGLKSLVTEGLPQPPVRKNRAQRRAEGKKNRRR